MEANKESECVRKHRNNNNNNNSMQVRLYVIVMLNGYNLIYPSLFIYLTIAVKLYHRHIYHPPCVLRHPGNVSGLLNPTGSAK